MEYIKIVDDAKVAVLFIHGILGTPNHFREFISLTPESFSVCNLLLEGHGKGVRDFSGASMKKWEEQVAFAVEQLSATHEKIYIVAHSMGTLLAMEQALKNQKICKLFLLAVPLRISLKWKLITNSLKIYLDKIRPNDQEALAAKNCCGITQCKNPFPYLGWVPRFLELFAKIRQLRKMTGFLKTPCVVFQSGNDEMVSAQSVKYLNPNPYIAVNTLKNAGHFYYTNAEFDFLKSQFVQMLAADVF